MSLHPDPARRDFRFSVGMTATGSRKSWIEKCRKAEDLGYDVIGVADHIGMPAPFPSLMLAAEATQRPRLATAVLNAGFYNPVLLARDVAATDQLTDGRLELGLGTGYMRSELEALGLPWPSPGQRVDQLEQAVVTLRGLLTDPDHQPQAVQRPMPPLWLGGRGNRLLSLAAREADIVGFTGFRPGNEGATGYLTDIDGIADRVAYLRDLLGPKISQVELNILVHRVSVTNNRKREAERLEPLRALSSEEVLNVPMILIGTVGQIVDQLLEYRERFGFSYITVAEYNLESMAPIIEKIR